MPKRKRNGTGAGGGSAETESAAPVEAPLAPFQEQQLVIKMSLMPSAMDNLSRAVQLKLSELLRKYHDDAGGVILSISNVKLPQDHQHATILDDLPFLHIHVTATALVFRPIPGLMLKGEVIKAASTHIAMLVYGIFNAAVAAEHMPDEYHYDYRAQCWEDRSSGSKVTVGDTLSFRVERMHEAAGLISIDGGLREPGQAPRLTGLEATLLSMETQKAQIAGSGGGRGGRGGKGEPVDTMGNAEAASTANGHAENGAQKKSKKRKKVEVDE